MPRNLVWPSGHELGIPWYRKHWANRVENEKDHNKGTRSKVVPILLELGKNLLGTLGTEASKRYMSVSATPFQELNPERIVRCLYRNQVNPTDVDSYEGLLVNKEVRWGPVVSSCNCFYSCTRMTQRVV